MISRPNAHRPTREWGGAIPPILHGLAAAGLVSGLLLAPSPVSGQIPEDQIPEDQTPEDLKIDVAALTGPGTEGRAVGTPGAAAARRYLMSELGAAGARPLPGQEQLGVSFRFISGVEDLGSSLRAGGHKRFGSDQVRAFAFSETGEARGALFFAGYGISLPDNAGHEYDSYAGHDVRDQVVVVLRYFPDDVEDEARSILNRHADFRSKATAARDRGAAGMVVITGPESEGAGEFAPDGFDISAPGSQGILAVSIDGAAGDRLFAGSGFTLSEVQQALDRGDVDAGSFPLTGIATLSVNLQRTPGSGANVIGILPAADGSVTPPYVAVGAHYDHLGMGGSGSLNPHGPAAVHPGADDNASGTAAVLALARSVSEAPLARPVLIGFWSGEESGLLGSRAFLRNEIPPEQLLAYINLDMVGRLDENRLTVQAMGSSSVWPGFVERANIPGGFDLALSDDPYLPTDSSAFHSESVPTLNLFTGTHSDYHKPSDTAEKLNYEGLARIARFTGLIARRVAESDPVPEFSQVERAPETAASRASMRTYTGTIPEYATETPGLMLGGVMAGGPAEKAGLQKGDVIVEFAGAPVLNIYDYMNALEAARIGEPLTVVFLRDGERRTVTLVPTARP